MRESDAVMWGGGGHMSQALRSRVPGPCSVLRTRLVAAACCLFQKRQRTRRAPTFAAIVVPARVGDSDIARGAPGPRTPSAARADHCAQKRQYRADPSVVACSLRQVELAKDVDHMRLDGLLRHPE